MSHRHAAQLRDYCYSNVACTHFILMFVPCLTAMPHTYVFTVTVMWPAHTWHWGVCHTSQPCLTLTWLLLQYCGLHTLGTEVCAIRHSHAAQLRDYCYSKVACTHLTLRCVPYVTAMPHTYVITVTVLWPAHTWHWGVCHTWHPCRTVTWLLLE
jgi:hypothetical protein